MAQTSTFVLTLALTAVGVTAVSAGERYPYSHQAAYYPNQPLNGHSSGHSYHEHSRFGDDYSYRNSTRNWNEYSNSCQHNGECGQQSWNSDCEYPAYQTQNLRSTPSRTHFSSNDRSQCSEQYGCPLTQSFSNPIGNQIQGRIYENNPIGSCNDCNNSNPAGVLPNFAAPQSSQPTYQGGSHDGHNHGNDDHAGHDHGTRNRTETDRENSNSPFWQNPPQQSNQFPSGAEGLSLLPYDQQAAALKQGTCPVTKQPLGSMGKPIYVTTAAGSLFVCCEACLETFKANPRQYLGSPNSGDRGSGPIDFAPPSF